MEKPRSSFSGKLGFILAAAGSAVGLGNIWRFPYLAAQYGGGTFLLAYIILAVSFGYALTIGEIALGRKSGLSAISAFGKLKEKYSWIGYLAALVPIIILPYYSVIGGWVMKYLTVFLTAQGSLAAEKGFFNAYNSQIGEPILWLALFVGISAIIVFLGVQKGVEKASKTLMPVLVVLTIGIAFYTLTIPGAIEGFKYYVLPDFSNFSFKTIVGAMGQLFYSMSLAMGIMITYGSYMKKDVDMEEAVTKIEIFDTVVAFFAGMMIVPAVFAFSGGDASAINAGPGLMFVTLPKVFASMPFGNIVGALFFLLVLFAALTSSISLMETVVSIFVDKLNWSRTKSIILLTTFIITVGVPVSLGFGPLSHIKPLGMDDILTFFDFISNSILMPIVALATCLFIGYIIKPQSIIDEVKISSHFKREKLFVVMIKYLAPIFILIILISSILGALGIYTI